MSVEVGSVLIPSICSFLGTSQAGSANVGPWAIVVFTDGLENNDEEEELVEGEIDSEYVEVKLIWGRLQLFLNGKLLLKNKLISFL